MQVFRPLYFLWRNHPQALILLLGLLLGLGALLYCHSRGWTTAHYDAKAHLVVARRIVDSRSPGYAQIGAHWLPLIHVLYLPFVLIESQYRSGLLPALLSVVSFAVSILCVYRMSLRVTGSGPAAAFASLILAANPNMLLYQSSPLTEPVYMMFNLLCLEGLIKWREGKGRGLPWMPAFWCALGALCRYEGWYTLGGVLALLLYDFIKGRGRAPITFRAAGLVLALSAVPLALHFGYVYAYLSDSFLHRVARGVAEPYETYRQPVLSVVYHCAELVQITTVVPLILGIAGTVALLRNRDMLSRRLPLLLLWIPSLVNVSALYWGLIYRVRYSILLLPAIAVLSSPLFVSAGAMRRLLLGCSLTISALPWLTWAFPHEWRYHFLYPGPGVMLLPAAATLLLLWGWVRQRFLAPLALVTVLAMHAPVLEGEAHASLRETREHDYIEPERKEILRHLRAHYDGTGILVDMSRLAPLIYDSALQVREFVYNEGDATLWRRAVRAPHDVVGWLVAETGDEVWRRLRIDPRWAERYALAVQTDNYVLYRLRAEDRRALLPAKRPE